MKLRVDYHFHPNVPKNNKGAVKKCKKFWLKFQEKNINCVIITEHAYKNPKRAYFFMKKTKPKDCFCFPGIECITKEGVDIIVFSSSKNIYEYEEFLPFKLSFFDLINFVNSKNNLYAFIPHPHTFGFTSMIKKLGNEAYYEALNQINAVEISNGTFDNVLFIFNNTPLKYMMKNQYQTMLKTKNLPISDYPKKIKFLASGSDAHHKKSIGNCYEIIYTGKISKVGLFKKITNNFGQGKTVDKGINRFHTILLIKTLFTAFTEFCNHKTKKFTYNITNNF